MGDYVTPRGVKVTTSSLAARSVGYQSTRGAVEVEEKPKKAPAKKSAPKSEK